MCGITGVMVRTARQLNEEALRRMTDKLTHRGPDGVDYFWGEHVALGHRRLIILDEEGGVQPMYSPDSQVVLTYNGEIYNFQALRRELEGLGYQFHTDHSDTEVLLAAYLVWGKNCLSRLRGMFAFAIWDSRSRELFIARDRLGIKPLYYAQLPDGTFLFASELKGLLDYPGLKRSIRLDALEDYLALGYVPDPKTILRDVHKLAPGHCVTLVQGQEQIKIDRYWMPDILPGPLGDKSEFLDRLEEAVKLRMVADVPLGAFLSGGVDSSTVVGLMARNSGQPIETCAIGSDNLEFDESGYAQLIADHFSTNHRLRLAAAEDGGLLDQLVDMFDEPFADLSALPTYKVCILAKERVTVALSGDGGDEVFAGYRRYAFHMMEEAVRNKVPLGLRRALFGPLSAIYPKLDWAPQWLRGKSTFEALTRSSAEAYFQTVSKTPDRDRKRLHSARMTALLDGYHPDQRFTKLAKEVEGAHPLSVIQYIDMMTYLPGDILTKVDRTSMACSLEVRVPILDHKFVEWGLRLSPDDRISDGQTKAIFKKAIRGFLPDEVIDRPKRGFIVPVGEWMRHSMAGDITKLASESALLDTGLIDGAMLRKFSDDHIKGRSDHHTTLWSLLMLDRSISKLGLEMAA